jgi:beta-glucanase (GH16 family)
LRPVRFSEQEKRTVKKAIEYALTGLVLACLWTWVAPSEPTAISAPTAAPAGWKLVWSDEFDKPGLPDPNKWDYEVGFIRNNELQYYTRARKENARVEGGCLIIEGRKEKYPIGGAKAGANRFADYTAASLITRGKAQWTFGRIEVRAKLPQGKGVWPAIWMLGQKFPETSWPACGEIDIMEFVGHTPDKVHATVHFRKDGKHVSMGDKLTVEKPFDDFHAYAVEWSAGRMDFFFDARKYFTFDVPAAADSGSNPFLKPQYLLINLALGGAWGREMDDSVLPQKYLIDHVRVYQHSAAGKTPAGKD